MSTNDPAEAETGYHRLIREAKEEAFHARRRLRREMPNPSTSTKRAVAEATADYFDILEDYADERALERDFNERLPVNPNDLLNETTVVEQSVSSANPRATEKVRAPAVANVPAGNLLGLSKELDRISKELGFAAAAKSPTPNEEATMSDLRGLLKARGQTEALKNLPDGPATDINTPPTLDEMDDVETDGGEE